MDAQRGTSQGQASLPALSNRHENRVVCKEGPAKKSQELRKSKYFEILFSIAVSPPHSVPESTSPFPGRAKRFRDSCLARAYRAE